MPAEEATDVESDLAATYRVSRQYYASDGILSVGTSVDSVQRLM
jgi:hypothetical protein